MYNDNEKFFIFLWILGLRFNIGIEIMARKVYIWYLFQTVKVVEVSLKLIKYFKPKQENDAK